ncbi:UDP-N-acetylmuramate dehydrogenase [Gehongia tenuis]|uniref:UDP-N-acetylenolpyruvoylglucosamine reductase n=1 Tax=Gehongia tenuis TaxID=2763655 RepID=A0A926D2T8_9FIRM|nr:UDP-N-acetylmuramate dehydrogenase [Gehongia tenuis]MBC8531370.1 UDP-N-acetylmuramate dehydrogenase [Gehongia tenuis]
MTKLALKEELKKWVPEERLLVDAPMKEHTSFCIGGPADILMLAGSVKEIRAALQLCKTQHVAVMVMGKGSNLLVRDKGIRGLVIKLAENFGDINIEKNWLSAQAGASLAKLARQAMEAGLTGLEFASGIPGALGGALTMNAGAYGGEMKDVVRKATVLDETGAVRTVAAQELELGYRTSVFQRKPWVVLTAEMELRAGEREAIAQVMNDLNERRRLKQPLTQPSAGSTFKRPTGYYAGTLIDSCGLKGARVGDAMVSDKHAGFIVNVGNASCEDVLGLIAKVRQTVKERMDVELEPEVRLVGEA